MDIFDKVGKYTYPDDLKSQGLYPFSYELRSRSNTVVDMEGRQVIMLGSNNYLGLTYNDEVVDAGIEAVKKYGSGCSGSRFLNGTLDLHNQFERNISEFLDKEDCILFGTGFQANLGIIAGITSRSDIIFCDRENHASIYDACKLSYAQMVRYHHNDMADLEKALKDAPKDKGKLIVTDGVFSMSGDICDLPNIVKLAKKYGARVMVDDAHGFGVIGPNGRGTAHHFGLEKDVDIIMGTFSKSLASMGGYCVSTRGVVNFLRHNSRPYIFCASLAPACVASANKALEIIKRDDSRQKRLAELNKYFRDGLQKRGIRFMKGSVPIVPVFTDTVERTLVICKKLFEGGVYVNPVFPPAAEECIIRISIMATHTEDLLDKALDIIQKILKETK